MPSFEQAFEFGYCISILRIPGDIVVFTRIHLVVVEFGTPPTLIPFCIAPPLSANGSPKIFSRLTTVRAVFLPGRVGSFSNGRKLAPCRPSGLGNPQRSVRVGKKSRHSTIPEQAFPDTPRAFMSNKQGRLVASMDNTAISLFEIDDRGNRTIRYWNDRSHVMDLL